MYHGPAATGAAGAAATLPFTGGPNAIWMALGGFALCAAGGALWRAIPKREK